MKTLAIILLFFIPQLSVAKTANLHQEVTTCNIHSVYQKDRYTSINSVIRKLYSSLTYEHGKMPDWNLFKQLFIKGARLVHVYNGKYSTITPDSFAIRFNKKIADGFLKSFRERELSRKTDSLRQVVHVFSFYRAHYLTEDGMGKQKGINSIQFMKSNGRWWITSILWDESSLKNQTSPRYLDVLNY